MGTGLSPASFDPAPDSTNGQSKCTARTLRDAVSIFSGSSGAWCVHDLRKDRLIETAFSVEYTHENIVLGHTHSIWFVHDVEFALFTLRVNPHECPVFKQKPLGFLGL